MNTRILTAGLRFGNIWTGFKSHPGGASTRRAGGTVAGNPDYLIIPAWQVDE